MKRFITKDFLELGSALHTIQSKKLYKALDYSSFAQYLATPEVSISLSSGYALIDIYQTFILNFRIAEKKLLPIGRKKLEMILPVVSTESHEDWLRDAEALSQGDLSIKLKEHRHEPVFEYRYSKQAKMAFRGDTNMEKLLEKKLNLTEWYCGNCDKWFWTSGYDKPKHCSFCNEDPGENGSVTYKGAKDE